MAEKSSRIWRYTAINLPISGGSKKLPLYAFILLLANFYDFKKSHGIEQLVK